MDGRRIRTISCATGIKGRGRRWGRRRNPSARTTFAVSANQNSEFFNRMERECYSTSHISRRCRAMLISVFVLCCDATDGPTLPTLCPIESPPPPSQDNGGTATALVARTPRHLVLQDRILAGRTGENAGAACGLAVLQGMGGGPGGDAAEAAAAPPPVVLAVAYREGWVDIALVPAGVSPRWAV